MMKTGREEPSRAKLRVSLKLGLLKKKILYSLSTIGSDSIEPRVLINNENETTLEIINLRQGLQRPSLFQE